MPEAHVLLPHMVVNITQPQRAIWYAIENVTEIRYHEDTEQLDVFSANGEEELMLDVTMDWNQDAMISFNGVVIAKYKADNESFEFYKNEIDRLLKEAYINV